MSANILVVDDEPDIRELFRSILVNEGHTVVTFDRGHGLIEKIRSVKPDLILLDIMLPGPDGHESAASLEQTDDLSQIPIIMVTALKDSQSFFSRFAQVKGFIYKPVGAEELIGKVTETLGEIPKA